MDLRSRIRGYIFTYVLSLYMYLMLPGCNNSQVNYDAIRYERTWVKFGAGVGRDSVYTDTVSNTFAFINDSLNRLDSGLYVKVLRLANSDTIFRYNNLYVMVSGTSTLLYGKQSVPIFKLNVYNEVGREDQSKVVYIVENGVIAEIIPGERNIYILTSLREIGDETKKLKNFSPSLILSDTNFLPH